MFTPTFVILTKDFGIIEAATIEKAAEEISPGTSISRHLRGFPPLIKTLFLPLIALLNFMSAPKYFNKFSL